VLLAPRVLDPVVLEEVRAQVGSVVAVAEVAEVDDLSLIAVLADAVVLVFKKMVPGLIATFELQKFA
jgi:hypothetical protein